MVLQIVISFSPILRISVMLAIPVFLETNRFWEDCFTGATLWFSIPCDGWNSCALVEKRHVPLVVFI